MDEKFVVETPDGEQLELYVLFTFESEKTQKSYVVYTDYSYGIAITHEPGFYLPICP